LTLRAPELLSREHRVDQFDCGGEELNIWLSRHKNWTGINQRTASAPAGGCFQTERLQLSP